MMYRNGHLVCWTFVALSALALSACGGDDVANAGNAGNVTAQDADGTTDGAAASDTQLSDARSADTQSADTQPPKDTAAPADSGATSDGSAASSPTVASSAAFKIKMSAGVTYAKGLINAKWGQAKGTATDLQLDLWQPEGTDGSPRPALVLIHGGGFTGGSRQNQAIVAICKYLAQRGWVTASISYRLAGDQGLIPKDWAALAAKMTSQKVQNQVRAMYTAARDGRAAVRWLRANAKKYNVDPDYIAVGGGSAGAITAIAAGVSEPGDYLHELTAKEDSTKASTNPKVSSSVSAILDFWGAAHIPQIKSQLDGKDRFDANDPPLAIIHGTEDPTVKYEEATELVKLYTDAGATHELFKLQGKGHGAWSAKYEGKPLTQVSFEFLVKHQGLKVTKK